MFNSQSQLNGQSKHFHHFISLTGKVNACRLLDQRLRRSSLQGLQWSVGQVGADPSALEVSTAMEMAGQATLVLSRLTRPATKDFLKLIGKLL